VLFLNNEKCPCCPNHCEKDNLGCGRGRDYFNNQSDNLENLSLNEKIIADLRKCGHLLHHNRDIDSNAILNSYSQDELEEFYKLLQKFLKNLC
jgi:hypothetical protein